MYSVYLVLVPLLVHVLVLLISSTDQQIIQIGHLWVGGCGVSKRQGVTASLTVCIITDTADYITGKCCIDLRQ